jgi:hypothetical protein
MMGVLGIIDLVVAALGLIASVIVAVESPGGGAEKRALVVAKAKQLLNDLPLPGWAKFLFGQDALIGILVDLLVGALNKSGTFVHGEPTPAPALSPLAMGGNGCGGTGPVAGVPAG